MRVFIILATLAVAISAAPYKGVIECDAAPPPIDGAVDKRCVGFEVSHL